MFTNFKNSFTSRQNDKCVVKKIITPLMLGYITLWHIINYNTYFNWLYFSDIHILQGSVATCLRHDGIFKHTFVANLLRSQKFRTSVNIWWSYEQEFGDLFFFSRLTVYIQESTFDILFGLTIHINRPIRSKLTNFRHSMFGRLDLLPP